MANELPSRIHTFQISNNSEEFQERLETIQRLARGIHARNGGLLTDVDVKEFRGEIEALLTDGWTWALGAKFDIDDNLLPDKYIRQRAAVLDSLEIGLGRMATAFRSAIGPADSMEAISTYHKIFAEHLRLCGRILAFDPDSELPDRLMPQEYVDHWR